MDLMPVFARLGIALGLGLLVGLQRERAASRIAGVRTFPMVTVLGAFCALLASEYGGWILAAGLLALAAMIVIGNVAKLKEGPPAPGLTTEVAMLVMFGVGAYLIVGHVEAAVATGAGVAVLLQSKIRLHGMVARLGDEDLEAIMQFALISMVILPILPDRPYGPYAVLNPRQAWLMVVLIVGIGLAGYIVYKFFGESAGLLTAGALGGLISSTATTVSYARRAAKSPRAVEVAAIVIGIASAIVHARVLLAIGVVAPSFLRLAWAPVSLMLVAATAVVALMWRGIRAEPSAMPAQGNPSELRPALLFGLMYAIVLLAVAAARDHFGNQGLYVVAALSGLTDVDAITLSAAQLVKAGRLPGESGWRLIVVALMSNVIFKTAAAGVMGRLALLKRVALLNAAVLACGLALLLFWPRVQ